MPAALSSRKAPLVMALVILVSCLLLFSLDHEVHRFTDLLEPGTGVALIIYFIPTYLICNLIFRLAVKRHSVVNSMALALVTGIPAGFVVIIFILLLAMHRL